MLASPAILEHDKSDLDEAAFVPAGRVDTVPAAPGRRGAVRTPSPEARDWAILLDYAAFVLEQEAEYCQQ
jgi:hypothetical protein